MTEYGTALAEDPFQPVSFRLVPRIFALSESAIDDSKCSNLGLREVDRLWLVAKANFSPFDMQPVSDLNSLLLVPTR